MRTSMIVLAVACLASPATAEPSTCNRFESLFDGSIEIGDGRRTAVVDQGGGARSFDLFPCGMWSVSYCGENPEDPDDAITLTFVTGRTAADDPVTDFVLLNGLYQFEARCGT